MKKLPKEDRLKDVIKKGVKLLREEKSYRQSSLIKKMGMLGYSISAASLSNILNDSRIGLPTLQIAAKGFSEIITSELGMEYDVESREFRDHKKPDWEPYIIPEENNSSSNDAGIAFHLEGRVSIQYKTDFISSAQKEVIEVGVRLKTFSEYFTSRSDQEYKSHIIGLLRRGVKIKGFLLDPESNEARLYFEDRAKVQPSERDAISESKKAVERLKSVVKELEQMHLPGAFEIYIFKHIPYNHFLAVDVHLPGGKMMVSHYIYGLRRAECPVWEFTKKSHPVLFKKYAESLQLFLKEAKDI